MGVIKDGRSLRDGFLLRRLFVMIAGRLGVAGEIFDIGCFVFVFDN